MLVGLPKVEKALKCGRSVHLPVYILQTVCGIVLVPLLHPW